MNTLLRRAVLVIGDFLGPYRGVWAAVLPRSFDNDDTGGAYLTSAALSVAGLVSGRAAAGGLAGPAGAERAGAPS